MPRTQLLIIDDHENVRAALRARLDAAPDIYVVGCTGGWRMGLSMALSFEPDVVLLETKRDDGYGLEALSCLTAQCPMTKVIVLTSYADLDERSEAVSRGAAGYLLKDIDTGQLVREIRLIEQT